MKKGSIRPISYSDLEIILTWRNQDFVRRNMYHHEIIDLQTHTNWFSKMMTSSKSKYFIYEQSGIPMGVIAFNEIDLKNKKASWAFYSGYENKFGLALDMEQIALNYAFNELKLNKLYCEVLEFNFPVISFHRKFGFEIEGIKRKDYLRNGTYFDIYQLALLRENYIALQTKNQPVCAKKYNWPIQKSKITREELITTIFSNLSSYIESPYIINNFNLTEKSPDLENKLFQSELRGNFTLISSTNTWIILDVKISAMDHTLASGSIKIYLQGEM